MTNRRAVGDLGVEALPIVVVGKLPRQMVKMACSQYDETVQVSRRSVWMQSSAKALRLGAATGV